MALLEVLLTKSKPVGVTIIDVCQSLIWGHERQGTALVGGSCGQHLQGSIQTRAQPAASNLK